MSKVIVNVIGPINWYDYTYKHSIITREDINYLVEKLDELKNRYALSQKNRWNKNTIHEMKNTINILTYNINILNQSLKDGINHGIWSEWECCDKYIIKHIDIDNNLLDNIIDKINHFKYSKDKIYNLQKNRELLESILGVNKNTIIKKEESQKAEYTLAVNTYAFSDYELHEPGEKIRISD